jgi:hypothetical protein
MSRDYDDRDAAKDADAIRKNAHNAEFLRGRIYSLQRVIDNAQSCISGRGTADDMQRYDEIRVAGSNLDLAQSLLYKL